MSIIVKILNLFLLVIAVLLSPPVKAEKIKSIDTNSFSAGMNSTYLSLEDAYLYDQAFSYRRSVRRLFFYGTYTLVNNPWILTNPAGNANVESIISQMQSVDMAMGYLFSDSVQVSFDTHFSDVKVADDYGGEHKTHWGDSRVQFKYRFFESSSMAMAIAPEFYVPTGMHYIGDTHGAGLSNSSFGLGAKFITEFKFTENRLSFNAGYSYFENAEIKGTPNNPYPQIDGRSRVFFGMGWLSQLSERWALDNELTGNFTTSKNNFTPPGEFSSGFRYQTNPYTSWHFGLGTGALRGYGGNDMRVYVGFKTPFSEGHSMTAPSVGPTETKDIVQNKSRGDDILLDPDFSEAPPIEPNFHMPRMENLENDEEILPIIPDIENRVIYEHQKIEVLEDISFDLNQSTLTPRGKAVLKQVVKVIKNHLDTIESVNIKGHTDWQGSDEINIPLSAARARTVRDYLVKYGIPINILSAQGYGSQKPIYDYRKTPKSLWEKNRRVEFVIKEKNS